ncbi:TonB-dependent siderophore receptor [Acinetobacter populi]|nr:TonB-dependent receptor [Acinetobacter populi]
MKTAHGPLLKPLVLAIQLSLVAGSSIYAVNSHAENQYFQSYNIGAGALSDALTQFSLQSGTTLTIEHSKLEGLKTAGLSGQYSIESGFNTLLENTPYIIQKNKDHYILVKKPQVQQPQVRDMGQLKQIDLVSNSSREGVVSDGINQLPVIVVEAEDAKSYTVKSSKAATKLDLSLKETPQSITVFTRQQIEDQNLNNVSAILAQTPGVTSIKIGQEGTGYVSYYSRGFTINNYLRDGIPSSSASFGGSDYIGLEDSAIYERVEITKGSTGLTSGSGNPAASLNYVRKRPTEDLTGSIRVQAGSWDNYRSEVDISGALNDDSSIRGRAVAVYEQGGNQQDRYHRQNAVFYGALDIDLSDKSTLTTAITAQQIKLDDSSIHSFGFITNDTPPQQQTTFGRKDNSATEFAYNDINKLNILLGIEHQFNDNWQGIINYTFSNNSKEQLSSGVGTAAIVYDSVYTASSGLVYQPGEMSFGNRKLISSPEVRALDIYASGHFNAFGHEHNISFGINGYTNKDNGYTLIAPDRAVPIAGYNGHVPSPNFENSTRYNSIVDEQQLGAFAAAKLQILDPLKLIVGSRFSNWERKVSGSEQKQSGVFTPYAGLIFDVNHNFSLYASYTSIFNPQTSKDANGNFLDPQEGNTFEAGIKADFYDGRLNLAAAYFDMQQDNYAIADGTNITPEGNQAYIGVDGTTVKGYEFSLSGEILPNWNINAGYTHTDAKDRSGSILNAQLPEDTFKLFSSFGWNKITIGGGVNWQSEFFNSSATTEIAKANQRQDAYWLVNLMGRYQVNDAVSIALNANNVLDEEYKTYAYNSWGDGRNFTASLTYKF